MTSSKKDPDSGQPFRMVERDYEILQSIGLCGGLTAEQIGLQHFCDAVIDERTQEERDTLVPPKPRLAIHSNCQRRLKLLRETGFIRRIERYQLLSEGKKPYLYTLTPSGAECLAEFLGCAVEDLAWRRTDSRLRPNYIEHLILTNDVRLAVMRAVEKIPGMELVIWHDELTLAKTHGADKIEIENTDKTKQHVILIPDAYFVLRYNGGELRHHFLEVDRGTETAASSDESYRTWARKIRTYIAYLYDGLYEKRYGTDKGRLLTVTTTHRRLERLRAVSEQEGAKQRFWFTSHAQIVQGLIHECTDGKKQFEVIRPNILTDKMWVFGAGGETVHGLYESLEHPRKPE